MKTGIIVVATDLDGNVIPTDSDEDFEHVMELSRMLRRVMSAGRTTSTVTDNAKAVALSSPVASTPPRSGNGPALEVKPNPVTRMQNAPGSHSVSYWIEQAWKASGEPTDGITGPELYKIAVEKCGYVSTAKDPPGAFTTSVRQHPRMEKVGFVGNRMHYRMMPQSTGNGSVVDSGTPRLFSDGEKESMQTDRHDENVQNEVKMIT